MGRRFASRSWFAFEVLPFDQVLPFDVLPHRAGVERTRPAQRPRERSAPLGEVETPWVRVHGGTSARQSTAGIGNESAPDHHDAKQVGLSRPDPAPDAHAHGTRSATHLKL